MLRLPLRFLQCWIALGLLLAASDLVAQSAPKNPPPLFLVETSQASYTNQTKPSLGFVVQSPAGVFIVKSKESRAQTNPTLRVNPLGLPTGQGFSTRAMHGPFNARMADVVFYEIDLPAGFQPLSIAAQPAIPGDAVKVWMWNNERRQAVELAATFIKDPTRFNILKLSRRVEQREVVGAPVCNANGEVIGIGCQGYGANSADELLFLAVQREWIAPSDTQAAKSVSTTPFQFPLVWRTWEFDGKNPQPAIASSLSPSGTEILLGLWHEKKWLQRPLPLSRLSEADRTWISAMTDSKTKERSLVPVSRAAAPLPVNTPAPGKAPWSVSKPPRRPCLEIDGVSGLVTFRGRTASSDRVFTMTDPAFATAVQTRTLDQLIGQSYVSYTKLGTLTIPAKLMNFPLLGQDRTGTCYVSHYREWITYYLGDRALLLPCLEDLRSYLNLLLQDHPSLPELFASRDGKNADAFDAQTRLARARSRDFLNNVGFFCRNFLIGEETMPYTRFSNIDGTYHDWKFSSETRQFSEAQFGALFEGLLLGQMILGESENHVMNIIGIDDDRLSISTWAKEYEGTLRELARLDARGPLLAPTLFQQFPVVARNQDGRVVVPRLEPATFRSLTPAQLKSIARFNQGGGSN